MGIFESNNTIAASGSLVFSDIVKDLAVAIGSSSPASFKSKLLESFVLVDGFQPLCFGIILA